MSNTGQTAPGRIQAFEKSGPGGVLGAIAPFGLQITGMGLAATAVLTSLTPAPHEILVKVSRVMTQVGLDKGPLLLFGGTIAAIGFALARIEFARRQGAGPQADEGDDQAEQILGDLEGQAAILASVQGEISCLRTELHEARVEAQEARASQGADQASDPMFRLAASLDQLGARMDKRMDATRQEMLGAVQDVAARVDASVTSEVSEFDEQTKEFEALRMDIADLRAEISRVAEDVSTAVTTLGEAVNQPAETPALEPTPSAEAPAAEPTPLAEVAALEETPAALPWELTDEAPAQAVEDPATEAPLAEQAPEQTVTDTSGLGIPIVSPFGGLTAVPASDVEPQAAAQPELEFPEPPGPLPAVKPAEGLELIDEMDEGTAGAADLTPPLFPELGGNGGLQ